MQSGRPGWTPESIEDGYAYSILALPAPEYYTGEVILGSTYRALLLGVSEANINLEDVQRLPDLLSQATGIAPEVWSRIVLEGADGLASPQPRGRWARGTWLPQLAPLVPQIAAHACAIGAQRSRGNPANLLLVTFLRGLGKSQAIALSAKFAAALQVDEHDDVFARFIESRLDLVRPPYELGPSGTFSAEVDRYFDASGDSATPSPVAARFARDVEATLELKQFLTRRQWTVFLETLLRLGLGTQLLWTCRANEVLWRYTVDVLSGRPPPNEAELEANLWHLQIANDPLMEAGPGIGPSIRSRLGRYAVARVGLNALLHSLQEGGAGWVGPPLGLCEGSNYSTSAGALDAFLNHVEQNRDTLTIDPIHEAANVSDSWIRATAGFNRNNAFFLIYGMGQLAPVDARFQGYDQSFILSKRGSIKSADGRPDRSRWIVNLGPSALVCLVHACCRTQTGFSATMEDFRLHLAQYGIRASGDELKTGVIGRALQRLGLVIDSPDAGGGRLLVDPLGDL